jgi:hypothetical protein
MAIFSLLVPTLILIRHRTNIIRLVRGEEARYRLAKPHAEARQPQASDQV